MLGSGGTGLEGLPLSWGCAANHRGFVQMLGVWVTLCTPEPLHGIGRMLWGIWLSSAPPQAPLPGLEPRDGLQRFHSLSVSSDTTMDSFASLLPDEVMWGQGLGPGGQWSGC